MSERHRKEADSYSRQVKALQAQVEPLKRQANELQAHVDSHREEIKIVRTYFLSVQYMLSCAEPILHFQPQHAGKTPVGSAVCAHNHCTSLLSVSYPTCCGQVLCE